MIAKISSTENLGGALGYNFKKVNKGEAVVIHTQKLGVGDNGNVSMGQVLREMKTLIPSSTRVKKPVFHCSINPHPDDVLNDEQLAAIAKEYMQRMGYADQPYIVFKHTDIARHHIHIVSTRVDTRGRKLAYAFEGRHSKRITDDLEYKYGLHRINRKGRVVATGKEPRPFDIEKGDIKQQMAKILHPVLSRYSFCSIGELNAVLQRYNLMAENTKTEYRGKRYDGIVYCALDSIGNKISTPINASDIGRGVGYAALQHKMELSREQMKSRFPDIRSRILEVMRISPKTTESFIAGLSKRGIDCVVRKNAQRRIYGITFIDNEKGLSVNGSRLGKGYAANVFNAYFNDMSFNPFLDKRLYGNGILHQAGSPDKTKEEKQEKTVSDNLVDELINDLSSGDTFLSTGNDDWKEAAWQRKLRRQNKVNLRRRMR